MRVSALRRAAILLVAPLLLGACGEEAPPKELRVAEQYGLAYAPVTVMRHYELLERALPEYDIRWSRLTNAASIREAMLADRLDLGFMGIPPFLLGADRGMDWQVFLALSEVPVGLVVLDSEFRNLEDLAPGGRIALPQPGSIQHILLAMESLRRFGTAEYFDDQLVTLSHPDAAQALVSGGGVDAHFATPPYLLSLVEEHGGRILLRGSEAFGRSFTFAVGVGTKAFLEGHPDAVEAFLGALEEALSLLPTEEAIEVLAAEYGEDPQEVRRQLAQEEMEFAAGLRGLARFSEFMHLSGYLQSDVAGSRQLVYEGGEE